jgi:hypothetical protein
MRLFHLFLSTAIAILLLIDRSALAQIQGGGECVGHSFRLEVNGVVNLDAQTRAGRPCQITFGTTGSNISVLQIMARPAHGILGASEKEENRRYVAYVPQARFVGHDRFEIYLRYTPTGHGAHLTFTTVIKVEMNVAP